jgi:hypothetical protein
VVLLYGFALINLHNQPGASKQEWGMDEGRTELLMSGHVEMSLCVFAFDTTAYKPLERMCPTREPRKSCAIIRRNTQQHS